jgi:hypothetical protein
MTRLAIILATCTAAFSVTAHAHAAQQSAAAPRLNPAEVVGSLRSVLRQHYVLPETRSKLDAKLAQGLAAGRYNVSDAAELAQLINADMESVAHDKHLSIQYAPKQAAELAAAPPGAGADDAPPTAEDLDQMRQVNHGLADMKVLPGNIRYLDIGGFHWAGAETAKAYDNAMAFLRGGDAIVIDLRRNGGGSPEAVQYLTSHFLPAGKHIVTFHMGDKAAEPVSTLASLPSGRLTGKPLYVLTSGGSASAAEEFAGHVGGFKLGELVGDTTAGAGFRNAFFPVQGGFVSSVSVGRAVLASTGKDWEGSGIAPTMRVASDKALDAAQVHALRRLAAAAPAPRKRQMEARATLLSARLDEIATALPLSAYTGTFGDRSVALKDGALRYKREGGPTLTLVPVGPNSFAFEESPLSRVEFTVGGNAVSSLDMVRGDGSRVSAARTR